MPSVTVSTPTIEFEGYFIFKDPFASYLRNKYNIKDQSQKLKVVSTISMTDMIRTDQKDPFTSLYLPASISEADYKQDLVNNVPIISLFYVDERGIEVTFRVPLSYINDISEVSNVEYINKMIVIDLNRLPLNLDTTVFFTDISDYIQTHLGLTPEINEVNIGQVELVTSAENATRETVRQNSITVRKSLTTQLAELTLQYNSLVAQFENMVQTWTPPP